MSLRKATILTAALAVWCVACPGAGSGSGPAGARTGAAGTARVSLDGETYALRDVSIMIAPGEDAWFRIDGEPAENTGRDCVPGLGGGLGLYGDLPDGVRAAADLAGKRLRIDFSGDGDDANFCFVGMGGLAGAEEAWLTIESADEDRVTFSMSGTFKIYDERGEGPVMEATASGTAIVRSES